jgi:hypothetical protein
MVQDGGLPFRNYLFDLMAISFASKLVMLTVDGGAVLKREAT